MQESSSPRWDRLGAGSVDLVDLAGDPRDDDASVDKLGCVSANVPSVFFVLTLMSSQRVVRNFRNLSATRVVPANEAMDVLAAGVARTRYELGLPHRVAVDRWTTVFQSTRRLCLLPRNRVVSTMTLHLCACNERLICRYVGNSWTIVYDTIYACQDREDDVSAGVKSTAVLFGSYVRPILAAFTLAFLALLVYAGIANGQSIGYFVVSCGGAAAHFLWQFVTWHPDVPEEGGAKFQVRICQTSHDGRC